MTKPEILLKTNGTATVVIVAVLLFFSMFLRYRGYVDPFIIPRWHCFILGTIAFSAYVVLSGKTVLRTDNRSLILYLFLGYLLAHAVVASAGFIEIAIIISLFLLYNAFSAIREQNGMIDVLIASTVILQAGYGILQHWDVLNPNSHLAVSGSFDNPAGFAMCLATGAPFVLGMANSKNIRMKTAGIAGILLTAAAIFLSESRTGVVALLAVFVLSLVKEYGGFFGKYKKAILPSLVILGVGLGILLFSLKKDSASGRLLIWRISAEMITQKPVFGSGMDSFRALYMPEQAAFFENNPTSEYAYLADNVSHPFNEYLLLAIEYGLAGLFMFLLLLGIFLRCPAFGRPYYLSIVALAVCALFSYPFRYPFVWVVSVYALAACGPLKTIRFPGRWVQVILVLFIVSGLPFLWSKIRKEIHWEELAFRTTTNKHQNRLSSYEELYNDWKENSLFLYNYAAELHQAEQYGKSVEIIRECRERYDDYDLELLMAESYFRMEHWESSRKHYLSAYYMCPNRFVPLYRLMLIYEKRGEREKAVKVAEEIVGKQVKVPSSQIDYIVRAAEKLLSCE